jgi:hypothetical protein
VSSRAEHISLESEPEIPTPPRPGRRKVRSTYSLRSRLRGCETQISILEDHYLSVRTVRPRAAVKSYEIDLRFANAKPVLIRHVSWFWLALAVSLALLGGLALWLLWPSTRSGWLDPIVHVALATEAAAFGAAFMFLRRTMESLQFTSAHGAVTLVSVTGGIGSARGGKAFFVDLIKSINAAKTARPQSRPQFLRDEMREHHRLRELGVLSEDQYEAAKARILAAH